MVFYFRIWGDGGAGGEVSGETGEMVELDDRGEKRRLKLLSYCSALSSFVR